MRTLTPGRRRKGPPTRRRGYVDAWVSGDHPGGFTVPHGQTWEIVGEATTDGNVVVHGTLRMRPGATLTFYDVDDTAMLGSVAAAVAGYGPHEVVAEDTGLWVMHSGRLDARGTPRTAWLRAAGDIAQGATDVVLESPPEGWQPGDLIAVAPTEPPHQQRPEERAVVAVDGATVTIDAPLDNGHAGYVSYDNTVHYAEVLNLTRDVKIRTVNPDATPTAETFWTTMHPTDGGHAHIMSMSHHPMFVSHVEIDHMGPNQGAAADHDEIVGRWAFHIHQVDKASWGSVIEGVVLRRSGTHGYVPHFSHGVTLRDCIAFDGLNDPFWWDHGGPAGTDSTTGSKWERCVAASARAPYAQRNGLAGFELRSTSSAYLPVRNLMTDCVAFDVLGYTQGAGIGWQGAHWDVDRFDVHHCSRSVYFWTNVRPSGGMFNVRGWSNGTYLHGAYRNDADVADSVFESDHSSAFELFALSKDDGGGPQSHDRNVYRTTAAEPAFECGHHNQSGVGPVLVRDCTFAAGAGASAAVHVKGQPGNPHLVEFVDPTFDLPAGVPEFYVDSDVTADCKIIWRTTGGTDVELRRYDHPAGTLNTAYNAKVVEL